MNILNSIQSYGGKYEVVAEQPLTKKSAKSCSVTESVFDDDIVKNICLKMADGTSKYARLTKDQQDEYSEGDTIPVESITLKQLRNSADGREMIVAEIAE